jgi:hypothetical protein
LCSILRGVAASSPFAIALLDLNAQQAHAAEPQFLLSPNPIGGFDVGYGSAPAFADLDDDGSLDLASGESTGTFVYYLPEPTARWRSPQAPGCSRSAQEATSIWVDAI